MVLWKMASTRVYLKLQVKKYLLTGVMMSTETLRIDSASTLSSSACLEASPTHNQRLCNTFHNAQCWRLIWIENTSLQYSKTLTDNMEVKDGAESSFHCYKVMLLQYQSVCLLILLHQKNFRSYCISRVLRNKDNI